jgi:hypothetical protein
VYTQIGLVIPTLKNKQKLSQKFGKRTCPRMRFRSHFFLRQVQFLKAEEAMGVVLAVSVFLQCEGPGADPGLRDLAETPCFGKSVPHPAV